MRNDIPVLDAQTNQRMRWLHVLMSPANRAVVSAAEEAGAADGALHADGRKARRRGLQTCAKRASGGRV